VKPDTPGTGRSGSIEECLPSLNLPGVESHIGRNAGDAASIALSAAVLQNDYAAIANTYHASGFRLDLQGVEFVKENCEPLFHLWKASKIEIIGPVILDADPSPCIQGVVSDVHGETGVVTMEVEHGFPLHASSYT